MKSIVKSVAALAAAVFASGLASAQTVEFTNELSSDVVTIRNGAAYNDGDDDTVTDFAGVSENAVVTFTSEKVDAELDVTFVLDDDDDDDDNPYLAWDDISWYVEFRPFQMLALGFHEDIYAEGSYLPVYDDNMGNGNFGSDGFTVAVRPLEGLLISATAPFGFDDGRNYFDGPFNIGFGAGYTYGELFSIGAAVQDIADDDEWGFGVFGSLKPVADQEFVIRAGFSHSSAGEAGFDDLSVSEDFGVLGENVFNASVEFAVASLSLCVEAAGNFGDEDESYDLYCGATAGYDFTETVGASLTGKFLFDFASDDAFEPVIGLNPNVACTFGSHCFEAGVNLEFLDGDSFLSFPLTWTYSF